MIHKTKKTIHRAKEIQRIVRRFLTKKTKKSQIYPHTELAQKIIKSHRSIPSHRFINSTQKSQKYNKLRETLCLRVSNFSAFSALSARNKNLCASV